MSGQHRSSNSFVLGARRGWNLVPIVVASEDIPEDTVVTFDMISQRSVPEQFVTSSIVMPNGAQPGPVGGAVTPAKAKGR